MATYRVDSGKHTLWEGDKETGGHFEVSPGDEFEIKKLPSVMSPFVTKIASTGTVTRKGKKVARRAEEDESEDTGEIATE